MSTAVLIQAHNNHNYIIELAKNFSNTNFYIHMDKKNEDSYNILNNVKLDNLYLLHDRYKVYWGGVSQVKATLSLLNYAYLDDNNKYFHFMSAECFPLKSFDDMAKEWEIIGNIDFIERSISKKHIWRLRAYAIHNDTKYLRLFWGRVLTKILKIYSFYKNSHDFNRDELFFGSNWFSFTRSTVGFILSQDLLFQINKFEKTFNADEHFFQILTKDKTSYGGNKRYIVWKKNANNPNYLSPEEIDSISSDYWFARKVKEEVSLGMLKKNTN
ncbi:beta-1,6-N-acetylglucosaminyltransferase [Pectobacterium versatile]|uniref:beta-1,6-N-acetylglucosaminyltransferase n=1 Tax=Pectobacterium versatile TaxID=2488639 RepID=UPI0038662FC3